jgi:hypothetical protein
VEGQLWGELKDEWAANCYLKVRQGVTTWLWRPAKKWLTSLLFPINPFLIRDVSHQEDPVSGQGFFGVGIFNIISPFLI